MNIADDEGTNDEEKKSIHLFTAFMWSDNTMGKRMYVVH